MPTFADGDCCVISTTDPYGRVLGFLDRSHFRSERKFFVFPVKTAGKL
jgi:hypothetical protein